MWFIRILVILCAMGRVITLFSASVLVLVPLFVLLLTVAAVDFVFFNSRVYLAAFSVLFLF